MTTQPVNLPASVTQSFIEHTKALYPFVDTIETPLPAYWNSKDKFTNISLTQNNLRAQYRGTNGKASRERDAASVRASHPIPTACGIYYYEIKIISKGRDGYISIGLALHSVVLDRLPGWESNSWGYHGDDGFSFAASGTGNVYGPTFTTGDVIGCCLNLVERSCFFTKNGINIGTVFKDLPYNLYPMIGLKTHGEIIEANFGQYPFVFDVEDYMMEWKTKINQQIDDFNPCLKEGEWHTLLNKLVSTYLVNHGYCSSAESFAKATCQSVEEELTSIKNRQDIQKMVLNGRISDAIRMTQHLYAGLLVETNPLLLFRLKCRQFVEMVAGADSEVRGFRTPKSQLGSSHPSPTSSPSPLTQVRAAALGSSRTGSCSPSRHSQTLSKASSLPLNSRMLHHSSPTLGGERASNNGNDSAAEESLPVIAETSRHSSTRSFGSGDSLRSEIENGMKSSVSNGFVVANGNNYDEDMEASAIGNGFGENQDNGTGNITAPVIGGTTNEMIIYKIIKFGHSLHLMCNELKVQLAHGTLKPSLSSSMLCSEQAYRDYLDKLLNDTFSLLCYADPYNSPVNHLLDPGQREPISAALNSAILESQKLPKRPPLEMVLAQTNQCLKIMCKNDVAACAFTSVNEYLTDRTSFLQPDNR